MGQRVLIAGAGIGGLAAAIALERVGFEVAVFERAPALQPLGAGLTVQINAILALRHLGLDQAVIAAGSPFRRLLLRDHRGKILSESHSDRLAERHGASSVGIHRARLHEVLLAALGPGRVTLGREVAGYTANADGVEVRFTDGNTARGALLIGADGLHSRARMQLLGPAPPRYSGYTSWRGLTDRAGLVEEGVTSESWGPGSRFGIVPIAEGIYWFAVANAPAGGRDVDVVVDLRQRFAGWHEPVEALLRVTPSEHILRTDIHDRPPVDRWTDGRVALLGDAAHPMTPNLGQGACQAIEDAVVLARCLSAERDPSAALVAYQMLRATRARRVVEAAFRMGQIGQWKNPLARALRNLAVSLIPEARMIASLDWLYDFTP